MNWSVDDSMYSRFKIGKLKCENILEVMLASLPGARKYDTSYMVKWPWIGDVAGLVLGFKWHPPMRLRGWDGKRFSSHKQMSWEQVMTFRNHSVKLDQAWISGITKFKSNWFDADTHMKPQVSYVGTFSCSVCRTKSFLQIACQWLASIGLQPGPDR